MKPLKWKKEFPTKAGWYWFYGERYRKGTKPDLILCQIRNIANGETMMWGRGQFVYEKELGDKWAFAEAELPPLPDLDAVSG